MLAVLMTLALTSGPGTGLQEVPFTEVTIKDRFWAPRQETNRRVSIPHVLRMCRETPRIQNLERAAGGLQDGFKGYVFDDSDVFKSMESAALALAGHPDPVLEKQLDDLIATLGRAQRPDGYLDSYYILSGLDKHFTNLRDNHELYCAGHMFEAAVAHFRATGKTTFLDIATKYADLLCRTFGDGPGQRPGYCGHPEVELALFKLWTVTHQQRYFDLFQYFLKSRGTHFFAQEHQTPESGYDGTYWLDDVPLADHREIKGHAVRAAYLLSGTADLARTTGDRDLTTMLDRVWANNATKRVFVTGGIGPSGSNEGFTTDYDLPNLSAYQETCASVAMVLWGHRMGLLHADARYWDAVERSLYNGFLAGVSLSGDRFFYVNPLASVGSHHRSPWFGCACCPPNVTRTLAAVGQYAYAKSDDALYVNLFIQGSVKTRVGNGDVELDVQTDYPWDGKVTLSPKVAAPRAFALNVRVPEWSGPPKVSGAGLGTPRIERGYVVLDKTWKTGDKIVVTFPMTVQRIQAHPLVKEDTNRTALQRGPIVYCLEQVDSAVPIDRLYLPLDETIKPLREDSLLGGVTVLKGTARTTPESSWRRKLYQPVLPPQAAPLTAVPYYAWDNRKAGAMEVWIPVAPIPPVAGGIETEAKVSASYISDICTPTALNDGRPVEASNRHPGQLFHFWPHKGTAEWAQYTWTRPVTVSGCRVYWFDDTGSGECRLPRSWSVEYLDGDAWKPVLDPKPFPLAVDRWCETSFRPVKTTAVRLLVNLQPQWSVGIHEWQVVEEEE